MVIVFKIRNSKDLLRTINGLDKLQISIPKLSSNIIRKWGKQTEKDLKASAKTAKINPNASLFDKGIEFRQKKNGQTGELFIRQSGILVDSMTPHTVAVKSSRGRLLQWALRANNKFIRDNANKVQQGKRKSFGLFVKPHPFIQSGLNRAGSKYKAIMKQEIQKGFKNVKN